MPSQTTLRFTDHPYALQLQELVNSDQCIVYVIDRTGKCLFTTPAGNSFLGVPATELIGKDLFSFIHSDEQETVRTLISGLSIEENKFVVQYRMKHSSGSWRWMETTVRQSVLDSSAILCETHDITLSKLTTDSLQDSLDWLTNVMDAFRDAVFIEENERVAFINTAFIRLYGYSSAVEIIGRHVSEFQAPEDSQRMLDYTRTRVEGNYAPQVYQFYGMKKDGAYLLLEASVSTLYFGQRKIIVTIIHDLSDPTLL
ncbi:MAG: PAS domain-containing protein [Bacteriovoracaceae bacterium]|nr:PAS domain-containing protein [Bacteroidota bacterium]